MCQVRVSRSSLAVNSDSRAAGSLDPQKAALAGGTYQLVLGGTNGSLVNVPLVKTSDLPATLACTTPTRPLSTQPMSWDGGVKDPRDPIADAASCLAVR